MCNPLLVFFFIKFLFLSCFTEFIFLLPQQFIVIFSYLANKTEIQFFFSVKIMCKIFFFFYRIFNITCAMFIFIPVQKCINIVSQIWPKERKKISICFLWQNWILVKKPRKTTSYILKILKAKTHSFWKCSKETWKC